MEKDKCLVSVVIPVYNQASVLLRTIYSVYKQTYPEWEILVVDDGSTDNITEIMKKMRHPSIHYIRNEEHRNANYARNMGIQKARGNYIAMLDADDEWLPEHLEKSLHCLKETQADGIYGSLILDYTNQQKVITVRSFHKGESTIDYLLGNGYGAQTSTLFMTADSAREIMWDVTLNRHQDYDFIIRYSRQYVLRPLSEATVIYHFTPKDYPIDFYSCIRFIQKYKKEISPALYNKYHQGMLKVVMDRTNDKGILDYYYREAVRYKRCLSYDQYRQYLLQAGTGKQKGLLHYIWGVITGR